MSGMVEVGSRDDDGNGSSVVSDGAARWINGNPMAYIRNQLIREMVRKRKYWDYGRVCKKDLEGSSVLRVKGVRAR
jgi:hypothetical protein